MHLSTKTLRTKTFFILLVFSIFVPGCGSGGGSEGGSGGGNDSGVNNDGGDNNSGGNTDVSVTISIPNDAGKLLTSVGSTSSIKLNFTVSGSSLPDMIEYRSTELFSPLATRLTGGISSLATVSQKANGSGTFTFAPQSRMAGLHPLWLRPRFTGKSTDQYAWQGPWYIPVTEYGPKPHAFIYADEGYDLVANTSNTSYLLVASYDGSVNSQLVRYSLPELVREQTVNVPGEIIEIAIAENGVMAVIVSSAQAGGTSIEANNEQSLFVYAANGSQLAHWHVGGKDNYSGNGALNRIFRVGNAGDVHLSRSNGHIYTHIQTNGTVNSYDQAVSFMRANLVADGRSYISMDDVLYAFGSNGLFLYSYIVTPAPNSLGLSHQQIIAAPVSEPAGTIDLKYYETISASPSNTSSTLFHRIDPDGVFDMAFGKDLWLDKWGPLGERVSFASPLGQTVSFDGPPDFGFQGGDNIWGDHLINTNLNIGRWTDEHVFKWGTLNTTDEQILCVYELANDERAPFPVLRIIEKQKGSPYEMTVGIGDYPSEWIKEIQWRAHIDNGSSSGVLIASETGPEIMFTTGSLRTEVQAFITLIDGSIIRADDWHGNQMGGLFEGNFTILSDIMGQRPEGIFEGPTQTGPLGDKTKTWYQFTDDGYFYAITHAWSTSPDADPQVDMWFVDKFNYSPKEIIDSITYSNKGVRFYNALENSTDGGPGAAPGGSTPITVSDDKLVINGSDFLKVNKISNLPSQVAPPF